MRHVFVETNWVFAYAAPAHHKVPAAVELLARARAGELRIHVPQFCLSEARYPIVSRCQPRREADAIREFLSWAGALGALERNAIDVVRQVLDQFEAHMRSELAKLPEAFESLRAEECIDVFPMNDRMLARSTELSFFDLKLKPMDQAVLAAVLVRGEELRDEGERDLCFCELDGDLQPWDKYGYPKPPLLDLYDSADIWVYGDFELLAPERPER